MEWNILSAKETSTSGSLLDGIKHTTVKARE